MARLHGLPREIRTMISDYIETPSPGLHYWYHPDETRALNLQCLCPARFFRNGAKLPEKVGGLCGACRLPQPSRLQCRSPKIGNTLPLPYYGGTLYFTRKVLEPMESRTLTYHVWDKVDIVWPQE